MLIIVYFYFQCISIHPLPYFYIIVWPVRSKKIFYSLFQTKNMLYSAHIYVHICAAFSPNSNCRIIVDVFTLYSSNRFGKFQVVLEKQSIFLKMFLEKLRDLSLLLVIQWQKEEISFQKMTISQKLFGIFQNGLNCKE